jgi:hypothetical protein
MPLEINELGIFMKVMDREDEKEEKKDAEEDCEGCGGFSKDQVVEDCVARVLEILENKNKR